MVPVGRQIRLGRAIAVSVLLIGVLTGTLGLGYAYWHAKQTRRTTFGLFFQELARHNADKVSLMLAKEVEWIERLSTFPQVRAAMRQGTRLALDTPELHQWREAQHKYFQSLAIVNREGRLVGGITSETTRVHYAQQPWWPIVFGQGRSWAGDILVDEKGRNHWEVAVPVSDEDGSVLGVLKAGIRTDDLLASVLRTQIGETGHVMLLGHGGHVLVCLILPPGSHTITDALEAGRDRLGAIWAEVRDDSHGSRDAIVGISRVVLPSHIVQERVWHVLVRQDPKETYGPALALMWKLAALWVGTIALIALLGSGLSQRIVQPLNALVERVGRLGEGQITQRLDRQGQVEIAEIETLAASFNRMAERLEAASQETRRYVKELETTNVELAKSEEHYRTLWDHAMDSKLIVDARGTVLDVNRRSEVALGRRKEDVIGTSAADLFVEQDRLRFSKLLGAVLETGKEESLVEIHVPTAAGSSLTMELDMLPIEKAGSMTSVLLQLSDVTEKKQLEEQLIRSERLASLSQFASMFAHDIRNPLAGIKKTLEWLGHRQELQVKPVSRFFEELQFTTELLLGMINDMLDVYQESYAGLPLVSSTFSLGHLLQEVAHLFRLEAESKDVTIRLSLPEEKVTFVGDRRRFQRVAINLVHNALKFSPPNGVITLSARKEREAKPEFGFAAPGAPFLVIRVEDEGSGLDSNELPYLFEMFFRKKDGRDLRIGRGLGLHFCRLVVEAHGGRIWAANRPTGGAVFSMALPLHGSDECRSSS